MSTHAVQAILYTKKLLSPRDKARSIARSTVSLRRVRSIITRITASSSSHCCSLVYVHTHGTYLRRGRSTIRPHQTQEIAQQWAMLVQPSGNRLTVFLPSYYRHPPAGASEHTSSTSSDLPTGWLGVSRPSLHTAREHRHQYQE